MADLSVSCRLEFDPVDKAARLAKRLLKWVHQGPDDNVDIAMERAASRFNVPARLFWSLRYRRPKDIGVAVYLTLKRAYRTECLRQEARLEAEIKISRQLPKTPARDALIRESEALLRSLRDERDELLADELA